jgi:hypothetical protein
VIPKPCSARVVAANTGTLRLYEVQDGCGRHGGVERVAASSQYLQAGLGRQWLAGSDNAVTGEDFRAGLEHPATGAIAADGAEFSGVVTRGRADVECREQGEAGTERDSVETSRSAAANHV